MRNGRMLNSPQSLIAPAATALLLLLSLTGCASSCSLMPSPPREAKIPPPPVKLGPQHSLRRLPEVSSYLKELDSRIDSYFSSLPKSETTSPQK